MAATSNGAIHLCSFTGRKNVFPPSHRPKALSLTGGELTWTGQENPCIAWLRLALLPLPEAVSVWYKSWNYTRQGAPWNWRRISLTQTCGFNEVWVGWFPKGERLGRRRGQLLLGMQPTNAHHTLTVLSCCTKIMCTYVWLSNSSCFWWSLVIFSSSMDCAFSIISLDLQIQWNPYQNPSLSHGLRNFSYVLF